MNAKLRLIDLPEMHPSLLWESILAATVAVLDRSGADSPYRMMLDVENVPNFGSERFELKVVTTGVPDDNVTSVRRTYEAHRLVELASIAFAGIALFQAGGHQIRDVALRGTSADYLVDDEGSLLEIAGRSRRSDFDSAWRDRWTRLTDRKTSGFYLYVCEFESPMGRLAFGP